MATAHPLPAPEIPAATEPEAEGSAEVVAEQSLVPAPPAPCEGEEEPVVLEGAVTRLPVQLDVAIPVRDFRVRRLLALEPGTVIETQWCSGDDLPLAAGEVQLAWSEFEVLDAQLAVRVTHLA